MSPIATLSLFPQKIPFSWKLQSLLIRCLCVLLCSLSLDAIQHCEVSEFIMLQIEQWFGHPLRTGCHRKRCVQIPFLQVLRLTKSEGWIAPCPPVGVLSPPQQQMNNVTVVYGHGTAIPQGIANCPLVLHIFGSDFSQRPQQGFLQPSAAQRAGSSGFIVAALCQ